MAYATVAQLVERYGQAEMLQLTDRAGLHVVDEPTAQRALDDAAAEIDAHVGVRYAVPLDPVPAVLARLACDIARYRLWDDAASAEVRTRYEDAVRLLQRIADGSVALPVSPAAASAGESAGIAVSAAERTFPPVGY